HPQGGAALVGRRKGNPDEVRLKRATKPENIVRLILRLLLTAALSARVPASYASSACSRSPTRLPKELRTASAIPIARSASSCRSRLADRPTSSPACSANA